MSEPITIERTVAEFADSHPVTADQLLPLLQVVQDVHAHISTEALSLVADTLNISRAEVFGVVSFYEDFRTVPSEGARVDICGAEACQALGCRSVLAEARTKLGQKVVIEEVFCLGNCSVGPSARVADKILGRATVASIEQALLAAETPE